MDRFNGPLDFIKYLGIWGAVGILCFVGCNYINKAVDLKKNSIEAEDDINIDNINAEIHING